jgi:hypothetical protein
MIRKPRTSLRRLAAATAFAVAALAAGPAGAAAAPAQFLDASDDGSRVFFTTVDKLVPGDTDTRPDVYERSSNPTPTTRVLSTGPTGGNDAISSFFAAASADGSRVFFTTDESMVAADTDHSTDVYLRSGGATTLVSLGPTGGNAERDAELVGITEDGVHALILSDEQLTANDLDDAFDIFVREGSSTSLVSGGSADLNPSFRGAFAGSGDVLRVVFETTEQLAASDTDAAQDVYVSTDGVISHVSAGGNEDVAAVFAGASADGATVFFETAEALGDGDTDAFADVYSRNGATLTRVSTGAGGGNGSFDATFSGASATGDRVFFQTQEQLESDTDGSTDVYERSGGATTRVSTGAGGGNTAEDSFFAYASSDGTVVVFGTRDQLNADDTDSFPDVYARSGGATTLVSGTAASGNGAFQASFSHASDDGSRIFFGTGEQLTAADTDSQVDQYAMSAGTITLVSTGPQAGVPAAATLTGISSDGQRAFFVTEESLTSDDADTTVSDIYERSGTTTTLISIGNSGTVGPPTPVLSATQPASPSNQNSPLVTGGAEAGALVKIYSTADCSGVPVGTGTAGDLASPGIQVTVPSDALTSLFATATDAEGDASECSSPGLGYTEDSTAPPEASPTGTDPNSPSNVNDIRVRGLAESGTTVTLFATSDCSGAPLATGSASEFSGAGIPVTVADDTSTTFRAVSTDPAGNASLCSTTSITYVELSAPPQAPVLTGTDPDSPANENAPKVLGTAPAGSTVSLYTTSGCTGAPVATGSAAQLAAGITVSVPDDATRSFRATSAIAGVTSACSGPVTYVEDSTAPGPPALRFASARANDNSPRVTGTSGGSAVRVFAGDDCQGQPIFTGTPSELDSGFNLTVPDNTTVRVRGVAIDASGNRSTCSAEAVFVEDSAAPRTRITFAPGVVTRDRTPSFRFTDVTEDPGTSFRCKLDRRRWRACQPPRKYKRLRAGRHVFRVRAIDAVGNHEPRAVKRAFRIVGG